MTDKYKKATRQVLDHIERVHQTLQEFATDGVSAEDVLKSCVIEGGA
jgi:hypothetical protein